MNSVEKIIGWAAKDLADWEADLVCRLLESGQIGEEDLAQITANVMNSYGLGEGVASNFHKAVINNESMGDDLPQLPIQICSVHSVENVNAIHSSATLPFGHKGLTLIYGENGSGKSGYTRILKSACYAKYVEPEILKNVYKAGGGNQSANISYIDNGVRKTWAWAPGKTLSELLRVNVYDSECGKILLAKSNEVTYKPRGIEIFDQIPTVVELIKTSISGRLLDATLPVIVGIEGQSSLDTWLKSITDKTTDENIKKSTIWSDEDETELVKLSRSIEEFSSGAATKWIDKITTLLEKRVPRAIEKISSCLEVLTASKVDDLESLKANVAACKSAYDIAVAQFDITEPLGGVNSPAWRILFEAAKEFSEKHAYIGTDFPNVNDDVACVLCMQPLGEEAKERIVRFNGYVTDKSKSLHDQAKRLLNVAETGVSQVIPSEQEAYEPLCAELQEILSTDHGLSNAFQTIKRRHEHLTGTSERQASYPEDLIVASDLETALIAALHDKLKELRVAATAEQNQLNVTRSAYLNVKKSLFRARDVILNHRTSLAFNKKVGDALSAIRSTKTRFSSKAKSLVSELVTPDFIDNFKAELDFFGVDLQVTISAVVKDMGTSHTFAVATKPPGKVLSEGEQKVISIAAFFAEIKTFKNSSPIILDDPVSSLDHVYREKIAERLALEALGRQVIIFTHDLSLIMEIEGKCVDISLSQGKGPSQSTFTIRRNGKDSGLCYTHAPWRGMSTAQRAQKLDEEVHSIKEIYDKDHESYNRQCALIYCLLREAWEALIEQDLLCQIVSRGRNSVQTLRLTELSIEATDANTITTNMTRSSNWMYGHEKSRALSDNRPAPLDVLGDIDALRIFSKQIAGRRKLTDKGYKEQTLAPPCEIG